MDIKDIRRYRLRKLVTFQFGGKQSAFADAIGRSPSYVARLFSDNPAHARNIGESLARQIEIACGLPTNFLDQAPGQRELDDDYDPLKTPPHERYRLPPALAQKIDAYADQVLIPMLDVTASMGPGSEPPEVETVVSSMTLERAWLGRTISITEITKLRIITGRGESMSPTIRHGDLLMVDTGITGITYDAVYVLNISNQLVIKRVQREFDGLRIMSDNPTYKEIMMTFEMEDRLQVLGRVVYVWNGSPI